MVLNAAPSAGQSRTLLIGRLFPPLLAIALFTMPPALSSRSANQSHDADLHCAVTMQNTQWLPETHAMGF